MTAHLLVSDAPPTIAQQRSSNLLAETRRRAITERLRSVGSVTVAELQGRFEISPMTARRDLAELERRGVLQRTHGGAVLPSASAHEDSFARRLRVAPEAKRRLAVAAVAGLRPRETVFLDSSTTSWFVAQRIVETGIAATVLTNSLPISQLVFERGREGLDLISVGGALRRLTRSFVGPVAVSTVRAYFADRLVFSVKGIADGGVLTDADPLEAEVKRAMIEQAGETILLVDRSKLAVRGLSAIVRLGAVTSVLSDGFTPAEVEALRSCGTQVNVA